MGRAPSRASPPVAVSCNLEQLRDRRPALCFTVARRAAAAQSRRSGHVGSGGLSSPRPPHSEPWFVGEFLRFGGRNRQHLMILNWLGFRSAVIEFDPRALRRSKQRTRSEHSY